MLDGLKIFNRIILKVFNRLAKEPTVYLYSGNPKAAIPHTPLPTVLPPTAPRLRFAPRPLWADALLRYRAGALAGERHYRCLGSIRWYEQRHRRHEARYRFHGLSTRGLPSWPAQIKPLAPAEEDGFDAADYRLASYCARSGRRARYARPARCSDPNTRLRYSRQRAVAAHLYQRAIYWAVHPRYRTRYRLRAGSLHFLAARRAAAAQCRRRGFELIRPGIWYDRAGDVVDIQTCTIAASETIRRAVA